MDAQTIFLRAAYRWLATGNKFHGENGTITEAVNRLPLFVIFAELANEEFDTAGVYCALPYGIFDESDIALNDFPFGQWELSDGRALKIKRKRKQVLLECDEGIYQYCGKLPYRAIDWSRRQDENGATICQQLVADAESLGEPNVLSLDTADAAAWEPPETHVGTNTVIGSDEFSKAGVHIKGSTLHDWKAQDLRSGVLLEAEIIRAPDNGELYFPRCWVKMHLKHYSPKDRKP